MTDQSPIIALAIGDPNGIGPELAVKAAVAARNSGARAALVGDAFVIERYLREIAPDYALRPLTAGAPARENAIDFHPVEALPRADFEPGRID